MHTKDMTQGKPFQLLLMFAIPLILGNVFQQCYTMVDTIIVGQGVGVEALASIGAGDWLNWMVVGLVQGLTQGFSIEVSQAFGEKNEERLSSAIFHSIALSIITATFLFIFTQFAVHPALTLLGTPLDIIGGTLTYLRTIYAGIFFVTAYNLTASLLRALGNSKTPLMAMIVASITNIVLDLVFVFVFHWGIFGAAFATILSQGLASLICIYVLSKTVKLNLKQKLQQNKVIRLMKLGVPMAFNVIVISLGGLIVQFIVNGYGMIFVAGYTAANKMFGILESAGMSFGYAISTYTGQNLGAKKIKRIDQGIHAGILFSIVVSSAIGICMLVFGKNILSMFIAKDAVDFEAVITVAFRCLSIMAYNLPFLYFLHLYRNALQGIGNTNSTLISGLVELGMRILAVIFLPGLIGSDGVFYAEVLAWIGAAIYLVICFYGERKKLNNLTLIDESVSM